jgi:hypothetical protein
MSSPPAPAKLLPNSLMSATLWTLRVAFSKNAVFTQVKHCIRAKLLRTYRKNTASENSFRLRLSLFQ